MLFCFFDFVIIIELAYLPNLFGALNFVLGIATPQQLFSKVENTGNAFGLGAERLDRCIAMPFVNIKQNDIAVLQFDGDTISWQNKVPTANLARLKVSHHPKTFSQVASVFMTGSAIAFVDGDSRKCRVAYNPVTRAPLR